MYILAIVAALSFAGGFTISYEIYTGEIHYLEASIEAQKQQADMMLGIASKRAVEAQKRAIETNKQLDDSRETFINTTNNYVDQLDRLRAERRESRRDSLSTGDPSRISENAAREAEFYEGLEQLVQEKSAACDIAADYAERAYQFTAINNCGIPR